MLELCRGKKSSAKANIYNTMITNIHEKELLERTAGGDRTAFRVLFDEYYPKVLGFMRSVLPTPEDAPDLLRKYS